MPYTNPTEAEFVARFPSFDAVDAGAINGALDEATGRVDETWMERDYQLAQMLYAAHVLTLDGLGTGGEATMAAQGLAGFSRIKSGALELGREGKSGGASSSLASTSYGQRFLALLRRNHPAVAVV